MRKVLGWLFVLGIIWVPGLQVQAETETTEAVVLAPPVLMAEAGEDRSVVANRQINFSALGSRLENVFNLKYNWNFGDGTTAEGVEASHVYKKSGAYRVQLSLEAEAEGQVKQSQDEIIVNVDRDLFVLISDKSVSPEELVQLQKLASTQGILIVNIQEAENSFDYVDEKELMLQILKRQPDLGQASAIVIWTKKNVGLNAFLEAAQTLTKGGDASLADLNSFVFNNKYFVVITDQNFTATGRVAQSLYNLLEPKFLVLTQQEAKDKVFSNNNIEALIEALRRGDTDYQLVGLHTQRETSGVRPWNFMSYLVGFMVDRGVPLNTVYLILVLPLIATIVVFARQVVGVQSLGIYTPSIIAVLFLVTGLAYGLLIFAVTLLAGTFGRLLARKVRLSYLPRMAIVLTLVCLAILGMFLVGAVWKNFNLVNITIFPILIMVLLTEKFIAVQIEQGRKSAVTLVLETLLISMVCYWLANWQELKTLILGYPEIILSTLVINYLLGRWTGLRLIEYYRFREVIKNVDISEKK